MAIGRGPSLPGGVGKLKLFRFVPKMHRMKNTKIKQKIRTCMITKKLFTKSRQLLVDCKANIQSSKRHKH